MDQIHIQPGDSLLISLGRTIHPLLQIPFPDRGGKKIGGRQRFPFGRIETDTAIRNRPIDEKTIVFGEVGLSGEVRAVNMPEQRVNEAKKLGFETCILPEVSLKTVRDVKGIRLVGVKNIGDAVNAIS